MRFNGVFSDLQISSANGSPASETAGVPSDGFLSELSDEYADGSSSPLDL